MNWPFRMPDPAPLRPYSRCVGRPAFIDSRRGKAERFSDCYTMFKNTTLISRYAGCHPTGVVGDTVFC